MWVLLAQVWAACFVFSFAVDEVAHNNMRKQLGLNRAEFKRKVMKPVHHAALPSLSSSGWFFLSVLISPLDVIVIVFAMLFLKTTSVQRRAKMYAKYSPLRSQLLKIATGGNHRRY